MYLTVLTTDCPPDVLEKVLSDYAATRDHSIVYYCKLNAASVPYDLPKPAPAVRRPYYLVESYNDIEEFTGDAWEYTGKAEAFQKVIALESDRWHVKILYIETSSGAIPDSRTLLYATEGLA